MSTVLQIPLSDLLELVEVPTGLDVSDPDLSGTVTSGQLTQAPIVASVTSDPNRYTVHVPFDQTIFSMGNHSPTWIDDVGITGMTDDHMHLFVRGATDPLETTLLALGGPATSVTIEQFEPTVSNEQMHGYTMVTSGAALHESKGQNFVLSREGELILRTAGPQQNAVLQSDTGTTAVLAGAGITIGTAGDVTIGAWPDADIPAGKYNTQWQLDKDKAGGAPFYAAKAASYLGLAVVTVNAVRTLVMGFSATWLSPVPKLWGWLPRPSLAQIGAVKDVVLTLSTIGNAIVDWEGSVGKGNLGLPKGNVSIQAEKYAGMNAGIANTIYGHLGSYIFSSGTTDMIGVIGASVNGVGWVTVWAGLSATMSSLLSTEVSSELGETSVKGKSRVGISSDSGDVDVQGKTGVRLASSDGTSVVHGLTTSYFGAGAKGFGALASTTSLTLGAFPTANTFPAPVPNPTNALTIEDQSLKATISSSIFAMSAASVDTTAAAVKVTATGNVTVTGAMILLG